MINVLSLFDGMSCGRIALERAGIPVKNYYASEIDKYAIAVSKSNYPDIQHIGDVRHVNDYMLEPIDLMIGGSPCQGFSFAGKQLNFNDPRSKLFFEFVRLKEECRPKYFFLENVVMKKEYKDVISNYLGVEPVLINSALVSAQNRKRLYWTNIPAFGQPIDKNVMLRDVLETEGIGVIKNLGVLSERNEKAMCLDASYYKGVDNHGQRTIIKPSVTDNVTTINPKKIDGSQTYQQDRVYGTDGKMVCLSAELSGRFNIHIDADKYRKLTPVECERLQTVPDNYTAAVSNSQRYKMLGNGWTIDVIAHFFKNIKMLK